MKDTAAKWTMANTTGFAQVMQDYGLSEAD